MYRGIKKVSPSANADAFRAYAARCRAVMAPDVAKTLSRLTPAQYGEFLVHWKGLDKKRIASANLATVVAVEIDLCMARIGETDKLLEEKLVACQERAETVIEGYLMSLPRDVNMKKALAASDDEIRRFPLQMLLKRRR